MRPEQHNPEAAAWKAPESVAPAAAEKAPEDEAALAAKRLKKDLAHQVGNKGWATYWKNRLKDEQDLPEDVRAHLDAVDIPSPEIMSRRMKAFDSYIRGRLATLSSNMTEPPVEAAVAENTPANEVEISSQPALSRGRIKLSKLEEDLKHDTSMAGWTDYWRERLRPQRDTVPEHVRRFFNGDHRSEIDRQMTEFINERISKVRFEHTMLAFKEDESDLQRALSAKDISADAAEDLKRAADIARAREDDKYPTNKRDWIKYWHPRLLAQGKLPNEIDEALKNVSDKANEEIVRRYVNEIHHRKTFDLARADEMDEFQAELQRIDDQKDFPPKERLSRRDVDFDEETSEMFVTGRDGKRHAITEGGIAADMMWGIKYRPDPGMPEWQWRRVRELSALRETRASLEEIRNRELAFFERVAMPTTAMSPEAIEQHPKSGVIAERMVQSLLLRLQMDYPDFGLKLETSNAIEDAVLKYDFKVIFTGRRRGVAMTGEEGRDAYVAEKKRLGMQFTIDTTADRLQHKEDQMVVANQEKAKSRYEKLVEHSVDDIVLVAVKMGSVNDAYAQWLDAGKPTGGPEQFLDLTDLHELLKGVTAKVPGFDQSRLDEMISALER